MAIKKFSSRNSNCGMAVKSEPEALPKREVLQSKKEKEEQVEISSLQHQPKPEITIDQNTIGQQMALSIIPTIQRTMDRKTVKWVTVSAPIVREFHLAIFGTLKELRIDHHNVRSYFQSWPIVKQFKRGSTAATDLPIYISFDKKKSKTKIYFTWAVYNTEGRKIRPKLYIDYRKK